MPEQAVFVYGTLRVGWWNHRAIEDAVVSVISDCTAPGFIWRVSDYSEAYPVAKFTEWGGKELQNSARITGDLLYIRTDTQDYEYMRQMELGAGYKEVTVPVLTPAGDTVYAIAYHYMHSVRKELLIKSGDWAAQAEKIRYT